jgi:cytochrome o ubiquinol oxidase subunit II
MKKARNPLFFMLFFTGVILFLFLVMQPLQIYRFRNDITVLFPKGIIGFEELDLLLVIQVLMLFVIIPVYVLTFVFSWRYRASNPKATYDPDLVDHRLAEIIWWGLPLVMTLIIGILTWIKTHELDPYKPIVSDKKPITIQVVALQWKWLFIYPKEKIASVNFFQFPKETPVHFEITADAPMNSFWIPQLGGQIYAMPKMKTELYLIADQTGDFRGSSANLSGDGFAGMHFIARASLENDFQHWVKSAKDSSKVLNFKEYSTLAAPSKDNPVEVYQLKDGDLFHQILMKYMQPNTHE